MSTGRLLVSALNCSSSWIYFRGPSLRLYWQMFRYSKVMNKAWTRWINVLASVTDLNRWKGVDPLLGDSPCEHCLSSKDLYEELSALRQFKRSPEGTSSSFPHPIIRCVICCPRPIRGLLTFSPSVVAHHRVS